MQTLKKPDFVYSIYIQTTPEKLWNALLDPEMTKLFWGRHRNVSDWKPGSKWEHQDYDDANTVDLVGKVLECEPHKRLVMTWAAPKDEEHEEKHSKVTFELKSMPDSVQLTVIHDQVGSDPDMLMAISMGWPAVLSSLKSLLETGTPLETTTKRWSK